MERIIEIEHGSNTTLIDKDKVIALHFDYPETKVFLSSGSYIRIGLPIDEVREKLNFF